MTSVTIHAPESHGHAEDPDVVGRRWNTGVLLLIVADASFVASLIFTYLYLRGLNTEKAWLASGQHTAAIWFSWLITAVLIVSAYAFRRAEKSIRAGNEAAFLAGVSIALTILVVDVILQAVQLVSFPFGVADSSYSSTVYVIASANLFHLLLTTFLGVAMLNRGRAHIYSATSNWQVRVVSVWWTWIAVAAVATALTTSMIASPNH